MFSRSKNKPLLDAGAQQRVVTAIKNAEANTSGELRVYMESHCKYVDAIDRAKEVFFELGMDKTVERNAIIIYLATEDHQFALFGDKVIYEKAGGPAFWAKAAQALSGHLRRNEIADGLCNCIEELGAALAFNFPYDPSINKNELPDEIVFGK